MEHVAKTSLPPEVWLLIFDFGAEEPVIGAFCLLWSAQYSLGKFDYQESIAVLVEDEATGPPGMTGTLEVELVQ
eukprot:1734332-Rhodomonas_salina.1